MSNFPELFSIYNQFYLGNYTQVISEASSLRPKNEEIKLAKDVLTLRAHVGLEQYSIVISEVSDKSHPALQVRNFSLNSRLLSSFPSSFAPTTLCFFKKINSIKNKFKKPSTSRIPIHRL